MKAKEKSPVDPRANAVQPEADKDTDTDLDRRLDTLDIVEAELRMADPNDQSVPFVPYRKQ